MDSIPPLKRCIKCGVDKPLDQFRRGQKCADGYRGQCKACLSIIAREYKQRPGVKEHLRASDKAYLARPEVREHAKKRERDRWKNDAGLREYKRVYIRERYRNNDDHKRKQKAHSLAGAHRRRARKEANGGTHSAREWRDLCAKYNHRCLCCGEAKPLTIDHVVPLVDGGTNDISNIQPLCLDCNLRKHAQTIDYRPK